MKNKILPVCLVTAGMLVASLSTSFAQTTTSPSGAIYSDGTLNGFNLSLGQTYRFDLSYAHSYVGFNIKPQPAGDWKVGTDGASNGGAMIVGNMGGALQFITVPGVADGTGPGGGNSAQTLSDANLDYLTRMSISRSGKVKIGVSEPGGSHTDYLLGVDGKLVAKSIFVTTQNWADFVFEPTYQRLALPALEQYLQQNKHLPNVPSAKEVEANGYSLGDMDAKLLQTVEELTLHVIDINKRNERLEAEVTALRTQLAQQARK